MARRPNLTVIPGLRKNWKFKLAGCDKVWSLPMLGSLPARDARRLNGLAEASDLEQLDACFELFDRYCPGLVDEVSLDELTEIVNAWRAASGIGVGESPASSD